jgi:hypothetical protein
MISIGGQLFKQVGYYFNQIDSIFKTSSESAFKSVLTIPMPVYRSVAAPIQPTYTAVGVG